MARRWGALAVVGLMVATGCSRSPEAQKLRHLERGEQYAARAQFREAIIEYRNVLLQDPNNAPASRQLGLIHYQLGEPAVAFRYLLKAEELAPGDRDVRVKLGAVYLLGGKTEEAREAAVGVLAKEPGNLDALALLGNAAATPRDVDDAIERLEAARRSMGDRATLHVALGTLYVRKRDLAKAERAFRDAVASEPNSVEAHSALGTFLLAKRDVVQAEREFKVAADLAPIGSSARMKLADFYLLTHRPDEAKRLLSNMTQKAPDYLPAWRRQAEIALQERRYDDSLQALKPLLKKNASDRDARLLQGRIRLARRETGEAIQEFQQVLKVDRRSAPAHYQLGLAYLQAGNVQQAKAQLNEATSIAPTYTEAVLALAELNIHGGAPQPAIEALERLLGRQPALSQAHLLLGSAYLARGELARATAAFRKLATLAPKDARAPYLTGIALRSQGKAAESKSEFEAALVLAPGYLEPMAQLTGMALAERRSDVALHRLKRQIAVAPASGGLRHLLGLVHLARREPAAAEAAFLTAIELEPRLVGAYVALGRLYGAAGRYDEALTKMNAAIEVSPTALQARMLAATLYERKGDLPRAKEAYEKILTLDSRFAPAANNLAWLHSEHGGDKDKALHLAQAAREAAPEDPHVSDTLGWILYQRGLYHRAVALLKESATKLPDDPVVQYHLGLASLKVGDTEGARKALTAAVNSPVSFAGRDEARKALAEAK